eukprot:m51a1_g13358 hypothetical protein (437) ;mRNA; f:195-1981
MSRQSIEARNASTDQSAAFLVGFVVVVLAMLEVRMAAAVPAAVALLLALWQRGCPPATWAVPPRGYGGLVPERVAGLGGYVPNPLRLLFWPFYNTEALHVWVAAYCLLTSMTDVERSVGVLASFVLFVAVTLAVALCVVAGCVSLCLATRDRSWLSLEFSGVSALVSAYQVLFAMLGSSPTALALPCRLLGAPFNPHPNVVPLLFGLVGLAERRWFWAEIALNALLVRGGTLAGSLVGVASGLLLGYLFSDSDAALTAHAVASWHLWASVALHCAVRYLRRRREAGARPKPEEEAPQEPLSEEELELRRREALEAAVTRLGPNAEPRKPPRRPRPPKPTEPTPEEMRGNAVRAAQRRLGEPAAPEPRPSAGPAGRGTAAPGELSDSPQRAEAPQQQQQQQKPSVVLSKEEMRRIAVAAAERRLAAAAAEASREADK